MKKFLFSCIIFVMFFSTGAQAQNTFNKGDKVFNAGIGIGSNYYTGSYYTSKIPPVSASFEVGIKDNLFDEKSSIGVGGYAGFSGARWEYYDWGYKYTNIVLGVRGAFHYQLVDKLDTYTGLLLGFNVVSAKEFGTIGSGIDYSASTSGVAWSWYLGARYYFNEKFGLMGELGYGISYLTLGVSIKL
ncbi:MAG: hypothetical protein RBT38_13890 [Bacteroidales bacterium]|jgi:hypothetical protein|nr:hypothetical protein [Bacteroidales bacterium]